MEVSYAQCSRADREYLDTLDAPVDYSAINTGSPLDYWYPADETNSAAGTKIKWAEGEFDNGKKVGCGKDGGKMES
jgi:hypothetical protein